MSATFVQTMVSQTMNLDLSKSFGGQKDLIGLLTDLFLIIIRMREAENLGDPASLRKLIAYYLELFEKNAAVLKVDRDDITQAKFAMVALIDETVLSVPGVCCEFWLEHPLQLDLFGDNLAGQTFYEKLQKILVEPEKKKDVLEVYYLCLSLGFEGKYKIFNAEERTQIMDDLGKRVRRSRVRMHPELSPHAKSASNEPVKQRRALTVPFWLTGIVCTGAITLAYVICTIAGIAQVSALKQTIQSIVVR